MTRPPERALVRAAWIAALAVVYASVGRLGLIAEPVAGFATVLWPPSGIALAVLARKRWLWPGIVLGALAVNLWVGAPVFVALGIAGGNTLAAVLGSEGLRRAGFDSRVSRVRDVLALILFGAILSTLVSASIGVGSLRMGGLVTPSETMNVARAWWLGDAMGDLVVAPLLLVWTAPAPSLRDVPPRLEALVLALFVAAAGALVFGGVLEPASEGRSMYLLFPPLVWATMRFGQRGVTASVASVSTIAVLGTVAGHGPFSRAELPGLLELQSFMAVLAALLLVLGAAISERDEAHAVALDARGARADFLAMASHELRTPLATLVLLVGTLRMRFAADPSRAELNQELSLAAQQTERLGHIISNLLDASRIERGAFEIERKPVDLAELVRVVTGRLGEAAARAGCTLAVASSGPIEGHWDRRRLEQSVTNLLENAFRYAPGTPIEIELSADEATATLVVRDRGPGIPQPDAEEVFSRSRPAVAKRGRGGLGLGLYIVRSVVRAHGGSIEVEAAEGGGARFVVRLPRSQGLGPAVSTR